jgi:hypothetical protein
MSELDSIIEKATAVKDKLDRRTHWVGITASDAAAQLSLDLAEIAELIIRSAKENQRIARELQEKC